MPTRFPSTLKSGPPSQPWHTKKVKGNTGAKNGVVWNKSYVGEKRKHVSITLQIHFIKEHKHIKITVS
jgi:hypothetical protein